MDKKLTVVVGTFNQNREKLKSTIESFLAQDYTAFNIIVVDDNHPYEIDKINDVSDYINSLKDERIIYIKNEVNIGVPDVFRKWVQMVNTSYFMIYGEGDMLLEGALNKMVDFLDTHSNIPAVHGLEINGNGEKGPPLFEKTGLIDSDVYLNSKFLGGKYGWSQASAMYRTEFFRIKDVQIVHDWYWDFIFHCSVLLFSNKMGYLNEFLAARGTDEIDFERALKENYFRIYTERIYLGLKFIDDHEFYMINKGLPVEKYKFQLAKRLLKTSFREKVPAKVRYAIRKSLPILAGAITGYIAERMLQFPKLFIKNKY